MGSPNALYELRPITGLFGRTVHGVDLQSDLSAGTIQQIMNDAHEHRLLVFPGQGQISGERQVEISRWFGEVESTFYKHPKSPHPDIFRVSNDESEGCTGVGRTGWHIDGTFLPHPFKIQTMHFWSVSEGGNTAFSPLEELIASLPEDTRREWDRLWFVTKTDGVVHPLVYKHHVTGRPTLAFHCGAPFVRGFARDYDPRTGTASSLFTAAETREFLDNLAALLEAPERMYQHRWDQGDFAIIDNLAVA
eukprot:CAMPEP_0114547268 /NCGR_PEP_ID=MMETSP0114-20121206/4375_1 /TAXON_ID=31324 /ORGANISM="Goniomonas sp, Strain m" /LENGTH=248 /DNA_ID=CAMNT_0001731815 /DNA_START=81 /DNA_END=823 /DNA_ORIENTATION=-